MLAHEYALRFGGRAGVRDLDSIYSAIGRPYTGYYRAIARKTAALVHSLCLNHGFIDGNKRTAVYTMFLLLVRSGYVLHSTSRDALNNDIETMITDVAERRLDFEGLENWFKARIIHIPATSRKPTRPVRV